MILITTTNGILIKSNALFMKNKTTGIKAFYVEHIIAEVVCWYVLYKHDIAFISFGFGAP